ncbi:hypothetical protein PHYBLDRAFT_166643 [Phycomyces blakesleeanus NRRL 1555(-)]|uniref:Uncharacterized protein n=1 Tax=Phycomyces blakesleeanus (strain ATCC 8743b / DSM 1359 / FGSC 10004 / NBRC 33097 / NRRL 1555) TaxID=763407 RepID=A0A162PRU4_PHYB8|nr:hypothetical protein PHYBLDRAFT_166643 [Phycomyces blakesleeanus NRRL 1555(-)]OAD75397.1 hypothetical protein PHYBLDRAFT_166643 [Phycomyces blakesleeanus NRRL 1555(-)]|eukprot:XP_018293437.1 hypothetical protein PHYBLDRAFT_166643 [Phycomyces blakesleeanus NRRL 1555(-)]
MQMWHTQNGHTCDCEDNQIQERRRLIKWRIAWLPPTPSVECQCGAIKGPSDNLVCVTICGCACLYYYMLLIKPQNSTSCQKKKTHDQILIAEKFRAKRQTRPHHIPPPLRERVPGDPLPILVPLSHSKTRFPPLGFFTCSLTFYYIQLIVGSHWVV